MNQIQGYYLTRVVDSTVVVMTNDVLAAVVPLMDYLTCGFTYLNEIIATSNGKDYGLKHGIWQT